MFILHLFLRNGETFKPQPQTRPILGEVLETYRNTEHASDIVTNAPEVVEGWLQPRPSTTIRNSPGGRWTALLETAGALLCAALELRWGSQNEVNIMGGSVPPQNQ